MHLFHNYFSQVPKVFSYPLCSYSCDWSHKHAKISILPPRARMSNLSSGARIIYTRLVAAFYSTLTSVDEDNTSLRSIIGSFEIQVLPSDLVHITNTPNEGVLCRGNAKWWEQLGATKEEISEVLTGKKDIQVRNIHTFSFLSIVRAVYSIV